MNQNIQDMRNLVSELILPREVTVELSTRTGVVSLDYQLGGGLPAGAVEIYGEGSVGKTSLLYEILATAQKQGRDVALCASEYVDIPYMRKFNMDLDNLALIVGSTGDIVFQASWEFVKDCRRPCVLAIDSATAFRPEDDSPGRWNQMIEHYMYDVQHRLPSGSAVIMVNQVRIKRSVDPDKFFAGETDSAARKVAGCFATRLELSRMEVGEETYTMNINIVANQATPPGRFLSVPFRKGVGVDTMLDLLRAAVNIGVVKQDGSWYSYRGDCLGQGETEASKNLVNASEVAQEVYRQLRI